MKQRYQIPAVGTILPAAANDTVENPGSVSDPAKRAQWEQAQAQDTAYRSTQLRIADYLAHFTDSWLPNYESGRLSGPKGIGDPNAPPPTPPRAVMVEVKAAEAGGVFFDQVESDKPACKVPAYTKIPAPQHVKK